MIYYIHFGLNGTSCSILVKINCTKKEKIISVIESFDEFSDVSNPIHISNEIKNLKKLNNNIINFDFSLSELHQYSTSLDNRTYEDMEMKDIENLIFNYFTLDMLTKESPLFNLLKNN
jgi:predicted transcriptional regulator